MINTLFLTTVSCRSYFYCFPLALANTFPWPFVPILSNFFEKKKTQNHPQCLSGLSRALFPKTFLEIAVSQKQGLQRPPKVRSICMSKQLLPSSHARMVYHTNPCNFEIFKSVMKYSLRYHPPSRTLPALIGASAFAFNKYPHKPYIF